MIFVLNINRTNISICYTLDWRNQVKYIEQEKKMGVLLYCVI